MTRVGMRNVGSASSSSPFAFVLCSSASFVDLLLVVGVPVLVLAARVGTSNEGEKLAGHRDW